MFVHLHHDNERVIIEGVFSDIIRGVYLIGPLLTIYNTVSRFPVSVSKPS